MSWIPRDMNAACQQNDKFTTCAPAYFMFMALITRIFGQSRDRKVKREKMRIIIFFKKNNFNWNCF